MMDDRDDSFSILTPVTRRRIESSAEMQEAPAARIVYQHTVLCQTAMPYRDPGDEVREWERQQGAVALQIHAGMARNPATRRFVKLGLPYGSRPRLILAHLNSESCSCAGRGPVCMGATWWIGKFSSIFKCEVEVDRPVVHQHPYASDVVEVWPPPAIHSGAA